MSIVLVACFAGLVPGTQESSPTVVDADLVVYGATSAGVSAALQATRMGHRVVVVGPQRHLGGLSASGLGWTDSGDKRVIGGVAREFYQHLKRHYDRPEAWRWQEAGEYSRYVPEADAMWVFEPHVAEAVFEGWAKEYQLQIHRGRWLDRAAGVKKDRARLSSIRMKSGEVYRARMFLDASYEGDLMAAAGVSFHVGREGNEVYGETLNGVQTRNARSHQFTHDVSPYVVADDPDSGLLPRVQAGGPGEEGSGDHRVQAYCYRLCLTDHPENRVPFPRPEGYDPLQYELLLRTLRAGSRHVFGKFDPAPNRKTDTNNHGSFSTDDIGMNYDYPEASDERRREILDEHRRYQQGYFWFLCNDPRVPDDVRQRMSQWGLAADEFVDSQHWPHQIYVREARRMVSDFVMTEGHVRRLVTTPCPVGMGSYNMDSHHVQRYVARDAAGRAVVRNEGDVQVSPGGPYPIAYDALVPRREQCENLLVPVCLSSSHIAYGSIRMEPVFMILGQSAATAAVLAIEAGVAVQDVDRGELTRRLLADGQVLSRVEAPKPPAPVVRSGIRGVLVDPEGHRVAGSAWILAYPKGRAPDVRELHELWRRGGRHGGRVVVRAEEDGSFVVPGLRDALEYDLVAGGGGWATKLWAAHRPTPPGTEPVEVTVMALYGARLEITGPAGQAVNWSPRVWAGGITWKSPDELMGIGTLPHHLALGPDTPLEARCSLVQPMIFVHPEAPERCEPIEYHASLPGHDRVEGSLRLERWTGSLPSVPIVLTADGTRFGSLKIELANAGWVPPRDPVLDKPMAPIVMVRNRRMMNLGIFDTRESLVLPRLPYGDYQLYIDAPAGTIPRWNEPQAMVTIGPEPAVIEFDLSGYGAMEIHLRNSDGSRELGPAHARVSRPGRQSYRSAMWNRGPYRVEFLPAGTWVVEVKTYVLGRSGQETWSAPLEFEVDAGGTTTVMAPTGR